MVKIRPPVLSLNDHYPVLWSNSASLRRNLGSVVKPSWWSEMSPGLLILLYISCHSTHAYAHRDPSGQSQAPETRNRCFQGCSGDPPSPSGRPSRLRRPRPLESRSSCSNCSTWTDAVPRILHDLLRRAHVEIL